MSIDKTTRINERIRVPKVRLIDVDGEQIGIVEIKEAQEAAREAGLDLVEVAPQARPPVCRIMDFGKYLYQQKKKAQEAKKHQRTTQVKEVKFRPQIEDHDYAVKMRRALEFLADGDKVKATVQFRGREMARKDLGYDLLKRVEGDIGDNGVLESKPELAGNRLHVVFSPPRKAGGSKSS